MHGRTRVLLVILLSVGLTLPTATLGVAADPLTAQADVLITISAFDLGFDPSLVSVPAAGQYTFVLSNEGSLPHDLTFEDGSTAPAEPGASSDQVVVDVPIGGITFWCSIPGHREAGMEGRVEVAGAVTTPGPSGVVDPDPGAPAGVPVDPVPPALGEGDTVDVDLTIVETPLTVAPGYQVAAWTFGGSVPGPVIRARVGDTIRARISNAAGSQSAHGIDFGASRLAPNDSMAPIEPGDSTTLVWKAEYAGVWLYQGTGTSPLQDIANGLYGMLIVEPRTGLPPVAHEFALVQGEWSIDAQGAPPSLGKAAAGTPDFVVFNGLADQYQDQPLQVGIDVSVRFFVLDAGPSLDSVFTIQGAVFDRVIKEGVELAAGNPGSWGAGSVDLAPGQGAIVETTIPADGRYPFSSRAGDAAQRGARGIIEAGDGGPG